MIFFKCSILKPYKILIIFQFEINRCLYWSMLSSLTQHLRRIFGRQAAIMVETVRIIHLNFIIYANVLIFSIEIRENNITSDRVCVCMCVHSKETLKIDYFPHQGRCCVCTMIWVICVMRVIKGLNFTFKVIIPCSCV